jgi:hypothetical protein
LLRDFVSIVPPAWQYPQITAARITLGEYEFRRESAAGQGATFYLEIPSANTIVAERV